MEEVVFYSLAAFGLIGIAVLLPMVFLLRKRVVRLQTEAEGLHHRIQDSEEIENQLETIVNSFPAFGAWLYGPNGEPKVMSESFLNLLGMTLEEAAGFGWAKRIPVDEREEKVNKWKRCFESGLDWEDEIQIDGADGRQYTLLCQGRPIFGKDGSVKGWIGIKLDITARVKMEEALRRNEAQLKLEKERAENADRAKSRFLANMSHEIRTPLSAIIGYSELLLDRQQSEEAKVGYLHTIIRNGQQLTRIINDILDLSKIESEAFSLESIVFSVEDMLSDIQAMLELQAHAKGLLLTFRSENPIPKLIRSDQIRIKQILVNLIGNALKFTQRGRVSIKVSSFNCEDPSEKKSQLVFDIEDTGIGMDENESRRLFRAFEQVNCSRAFGGAGLGLYLARKLACAMGGDVTLVRSQKGEGSVFRATIVVEKVNDEVFTIAPMQTVKRSFSVAAPLSGLTNLQGVKVLVVDDSIDMQHLVQRILQANGAKVECANDGIEGVSRALKEDFDVVIMDIEMPKSNGHEAIVKLRKSAYSKPVIALTAHAMRGERENCLSEGFSEYLVKPIQSQAMLTTVSRYVHQ